MKAILHSLGIDVSDKWLALLLPSSHILVILLLSWLLMRVSGKLIRIFKSYVTRTSHDAGSIKRAETLSQVFSHVSIVTITLITGMLILGEMGISIAPILAAAGVVGLAVGFGAQSLIKDYFTGFFLLIEDQIRHGEVIEVAGKKGKVEEVTLRHVRLRDFEGSVHFIPNSAITTVTNKSRDFCYAVVDLSVAYRENVDAVYEVIRKVGAEMRISSEFKHLILEDLEMLGINELADSAVVIRCRFKVDALEQWDVKREFLYRIKIAFDDAGIEIPYPHLTLYAGEMKKAGATPAFKIQSQPMDIG
jgi:moderate conductance mechanosensitive channel